MSGAKLSRAHWTALGNVWKYGDASEIGYSGTGRECRDRLFDALLERGYVRPYSQSFTTTKILYDDGREEILESECVRYRVTPAGKRAYRRETMRRQAVAQE